MATTFNWTLPEGTATVVMSSTTGSATASAEKFNITFPSYTIKSNYPSSGSRRYKLNLDADTPSGSPSSYSTGWETAWSNYVGANAVATVPSAKIVYEHTTSVFFGTFNSTQKTISVPIKMTGNSVRNSAILYQTSGGTESFVRPTAGQWTLYTLSLTLDVPPTVTLGTPTYTTPHYTGLGTYSVPITSAEAYYGGNITKVTLAIGPNTVEQTYSDTSISDETISVTPTIAGTYTPTLTVTDSRGQTTTTTFSQITVNQYNAPSFDFDVFRSNSNGVKDDEGAYGLVTANISFTDAVADMTEPTVQINGTTTSNVTWYLAYNSSTGVSSAISDWSTVSSGDTIYGLINGSFSQTDSYQITVQIEDSLGGESSAISQTLSTAFYTIDFQAGGKEISFGGPANDNLTSYPNGLFKCGMDTVLNGDVAVNGDLTAIGDTTLTTGDTEIENPYYSLDTTAASGTTDGDLYAAITALSWQSDDPLDVKKLLTEMLTMLKEHDVDYVVEESISSTWKYRKWNSGILECWYEANPGAYTIGTQRGSMYAGAWITYTFPASFAYTPTVVASAMLTTDAYVVLAQTSSPQTTGVRVRLTASASVASNSNYTLHIYAIGRWK